MRARRVLLALFVLSCLFYLVFLAGWGVVIGRFFPRGFGRAAAIALVGLSGVCAHVAFSQSDQGLWMAVSALIAAALASGSERWTITLLTLAPWVRPEGILLKGHEFTLPAMPGRAAQFVLRTAGKLTYAEEGGEEKSVEFGKARTVRLSVDGRELGAFEIPLRPDACTDYVMDIPADFLVASRVRFRVEGNLPVFGYWLYQ